jgi:hypothetical protein
MYINILHFEFKIAQIQYSVIYAFFKNNFTHKKLFKYY